MFATWLRRFAALLLLEQVCRSGDRRADGSGDRGTDGPGDWAAREAARLDDVEIERSQLKTKLLHLLNDSDAPVYERIETCGVDLPLLICHEQIPPERDN